jgi:hypothetical protein
MGRGVTGVLVAAPEIVGPELEAAGPEGGTALLAEPLVAEVERAESAAAITPSSGIAGQALVHSAPRRIPAVVAIWPV